VRRIKRSGCPVHEPEQGRSAGIGDFRCATVDFNQDSSLALTLQVVALFAASYESMLEKSHPRYLVSLSIAMEYPTMLGMAFELFTIASRQLWETHESTLVIYIASEVYFSWLARLEPYDGKHHHTQKT